MKHHLITPTHHPSSFLFCFPLIPTQFSPMRITVDIEDDVLAELMKITGDKNKSPAVARAVTEFVRRKQAREFGRMIREGVFDYPDAPTDPSGNDAANPVPPLYPD
jgi:Arc/MetJ family transcription regulator